MPMEYFDTLSSARCSMPTRSSDGADAVLGRRLARCGQDLEVLPAGQMAVEPGFVDDGTDPGQRAVTMARDWIAEERHRAGVGMRQSEQHPDEGGLPGPVGAEVAEGAPPRNEQLHAVDGDVVAEPLGQPVGLHGPLAGVTPRRRERRPWR